MGLGALKIGLDVTPAFIGSTGISRYAKMLWSCLRERADIEVRAFAAGRGQMPTQGVRTIRVPLRVLHKMWTIAKWPTAEMLVGDVDIVHSIDLIPFPTRRPLVSTINDALALTHPHLVAPRGAWIQRRQLAAAREASIVVTSCNATANILVDVARIPRERIVVAPPGAREMPTEPAPPLVPPPYVLAVGEVTPRKGFELLAEAAAALGASCPPVVIAGPDGWMAKSVRARIAELDRDGKVQLIGRVSAGDLDRLYTHASVLCHPSHAEGFGLPCLEAMTFGIPTIATDLPSVREFGGRAIEFVPTGNPDALAACLQSLLKDPERQRQLARRGRESAASFSWEGMTLRIVDAYRHAIAQVAL